MRKSYRLLYDRFDFPADSIVYEFTGPTYGLVTEDILYTGKEHIAITMDPEGGTPFITVPIEMVEEIHFVS